MKKATPPAFRLVRRFGGDLAGGMPSRRRLPITLAMIPLVALFALVPGILYFTELALRELRFLWWLILLLGGLCWLLLRFDRRK